MARISTLRTNITLVNAFISPLLYSAQTGCLTNPPIQRVPRRKADGEWTVTAFPHMLYRTVLNILKPTGYVMHQQFNIQQLYALPTLYLCVLYLSENKQRREPLTA